MPTTSSQTSQLWSAPATEIVALLRTRQVSPAELIDVLAARIEAVDDAVNALPIKFYDQARERAERLPRRASEARPGWLAGLPIVVKDYNDVAGQPTTYGSPLFAGALAARSDATVAMLERSGAIPLAKSNVPEFAGANTVNPVFGATRNPWDTRMSAGGSSGGSGAALATGMAWLATGNDLGGSLRIPASFCSVVGLRPTPGRVARPEAQLPYDPLWVEGPMGRTVADVALMLDAQLGAHPSDPLSLPEPAISFTDALDRLDAPRRVAFSANLGISAVDPTVSSVCEDAARGFAEVGTEVDEACPDLEGAIETFETLRALLFATMRGELLASHRDDIDTDIAGNIDKGLGLSIEQVIAAERRRAQLIAGVRAFFDTYDLLLCPTVAVPPFPVSEKYPADVAGQPTRTYIDWMFLTFVITVAACPAISVPCGFTPDGLPIGMQIIGRPREEARLLAAAQRFEHAVGVEPGTPLDPRAP